MIVHDRTPGIGLVRVVIKSLWASIQGNPTFMLKVNGWLTIFWIAMIPVSVFTGLINSVAFISALSLWALVSGHWAAWQAARVEVKQARDEERRDDNAPQRIEQKVDELHQKV